MMQLSRDQDWYLRRLAAWHTKSPTPATFRRECFPKVCLLLAVGVASFLFFVFYAATAAHPYFVYVGWFTLGQACGMAYIFWISRKSEALELWPLVQNLIDPDRLTTAAGQLEHKR